MKPLIGISPSPDEVDMGHGHFRRYALSNTYTQSVLAAGGVPVILPPHVEAIDDILDQLDGIIDVTLVYEPTTRPLAWSWLCGEQRNLVVSVRLLPLPEAVMRSSGEAQRRAAQQWLHALWQEKDARLEARG